MSPGGAASLQQARDLLAQGRQAEALGLLESMQKSGSGGFQARIALGNQYLDCQRPEEAAEVFGRLLSEQPQDLEARSGLGVALVLGGQTARGRRELEDCVALSAGAPVHLANLARCLMLEERWDQAQELLAQALAHPCLKAEGVSELTELLGACRQGGAGAPGTAAAQPRQTPGRAAAGGPRRLAVLCLPGLEHFLQDIVQALQARYEVRTCYSSQPTEIIEAIRWADTLWLEWANELAINLTGQAGLLEGKRVICRLHSYEAFDGLAAKVCWDKVGDLIYVSDHVADYLKRQVPGLASGNTRLWRIPNGVDLAGFKFRARERGFNLAFLGSINFKKGPMLLLHAFHQLSLADERYTLWVGGNFQDSRHALYFDHMIRELGLKERVRMDGWVSDVSGWLEDKHFIVCSSLLEGHPVGLMEGMACGLRPLIHNYVGARCSFPDRYLWSGIPQFVQQVLHSPYDPLEYRLFVEQNYSTDRQVQRILELLES